MNPKHEPTAAPKRTDERERAAPPAPPRPERESDDLDLDLEEADDGDRLKEGFTGQER